MSCNCSGKTYRTCEVEGKPALFHGWFPFDRIIYDGRNALKGALATTVGIVEFEDGSIRNTLPEQIKFTDYVFKEYCTENVRPTEEKKPEAVWTYWSGWKSNHDQRIDDATCSACGFKHGIVHNSNQLPYRCPSCDRTMGNRG